MNRLTSQRAPKLLSKLLTGVTLSSLSSSWSFCEKQIILTDQLGKCFSAVWVYSQRIYLIQLQFLVVLAYSHVQILEIHVSISDFADL